MSNMKLLLSLLLLPAGSAVAQTSLIIRVTDNGVESVAKVSGAPAVQGLSVLKSWMLTQATCTTIPEVPGVPAVLTNGVATTPAVPAVPASQSCVPKYADPAALIKALTLDTAEQLAPQFPSPAMKPLVDAEEAAKAATIAARKAAFAAARAEKP